MIELNQLSDSQYLEQFLQQYWQQKPVVIRQGIKAFSDIISPDELAGLACEELVQSRLIYKKDQQWQAEQGPFESYDHLGEQDWSLVLQAVDNWSPEVAELTEAFKFLPDWRRDDVMISFAAKGGSVGPHIDNYDTFICQGSGVRHWRVGDSGQHKQFAAHQALLHVEPFDAIIDVELNCGDILYIPPGYPHEGIALEPSMSFSVGYRTESAKDMLSGLADHLIDHDLANQMLVDPKRAMPTAMGIIDNQDLDRIRQHLLSVINDEKLLVDFCGHHLSAPKHTLAAPEEPLDFTAAEIIEQLQYQPLVRLEGLRCYYFEASIDKGHFYINGELCQLDPTLKHVIENLCNFRQLDYQLLAEGLENIEFVRFITEYINQGCWYFIAE